VNKYQAAAWVFAGTLVMAAGAYPAEIRVGYVDVVKVFQHSPKAQETEDLFKKEVEAEEGKLNTQESALKTAQDEFEKQKDLMKPEERQKKETELRDKMQEFFTLRRDTYQRLDKRRQSLTESCVQEIVKVVQEYGKKNNFTVILDARSVIYGKDGADITEEIIKVLSK